jgi:outer membrane receptor protein involved in Fe transport
MNKQLVRHKSVLEVAVQECLARNRPRGSVLVVSVAAAGLQMGTFGAVALAQAKPELEEIIVSATRRQQTVQEIPFNISAVSGATLEQANISDAVEAMRSVAGVTMQDRGYRNAGVASTVVIRGLNVDSGANGDVPLAAPPTVATYVDNTALYGVFILKDIERVEVLRGPQGTLYGSGSLAGNVRYIMKKPDVSGFSGKASLNFGTTEGSDGYNLNADLLLNLPVSETFAFRLNAGMIDNDGIVDYPNVYQTDANGDPVVDGDVLTALPVYQNVEDVDDVDIKYARVSALYEPSEKFSAQLSYQWQEDEVGGRRQVTRGENLVSGGTYGDYEFGAVQLEPSEREVELAALELEIDLGFATLTSSTSQYDHTGTGISDNSGVYARNGWFVYYGSSPRPIAQAERFYDDSAFAQEVRLVSTGERYVDWTAGLYYTDQDYDLGQNSYLVGYIPYLDARDWYGLAPYSTNQDFLFRRNQAYDETALFGEVTINFTDDVHLTLGGRYFDNSVDVDAVVDVPIYSSPTNPPGVAAEKIDDDGFLFKANLAWDLSDTSMLYGTFSQGYRHAGANAVPTTGRYAENPDYLTFDSDTVDNYELGWKGFHGDHAYAVSAYYVDWTDPQLNTTTSNWGFFAAINGESARTSGIEIELSGPLPANLRYNLGYTYADAELTDDVYRPAGNFGGNGNLTERQAAEDGDRLPGSAEHVFNVALTHSLDFSGDMGLTTVLSGYYQSDMLNSLGSDDPTDPLYNRFAAEIDGFSLWNLSSTLARDAWAASLYIKNLFNADGTTGVVPVAVAGPNDSATERYIGNNSRDYIALPRTIGLVITYDF